MTTENRTLKFNGYAYGADPVAINAHINGQVVFSGIVDTNPATLPLSGDVDMSTAPVLFEVPNCALAPTDFAGSLPMTVSVANGYGILLGNVTCNYMQVHNGNITYNGNATAFTSCYNGTPVNSENTPDTRSSVTIDNVTQVPPLTPSKGCWTWAIDAGSTIAHNFNISLGNVAP
jgi:hypothetical protein